MTDPTIAHAGEPADPQLDEIISQLIRIRARLTVIVGMAAVPILFWLLALMTA